MISTPAHDAITLHYQPWQDALGRTCGLEALMRWHHQRRGAESPEAFIPVFQGSGLRGSLSRWALRQACTDATSWVYPLTVTVKLPHAPFTELDLPKLIASFLDLTGLSADRLELEVPEATWFTDGVRTRELIAGLDRLGVRVALDDFGTGDAMPPHLPNYPFSKLHIDTSFIAAIDRSESARWIVSTLIECGHSRDIVVAADGVETPSQLAFLLAQGCDLVQGPLLGEPAPIDTLSPLTGSRPALPAATPPVTEAAPMRGT